MQIYPQPSILYPQPQSPSARTWYVYLCIRIVLRSREGDSNSLSSSWAEILDAGSGIFFF